jgi:hypothetical protein
MICKVRTLLKAFLEIAFLRKGPSEIPHSTLLFSAAAGLFLLVSILGVALEAGYSRSGLAIDLVLTAVAIGLYFLIVNIFGNSERFLRSLTAILGCSAVIGAASIGGRTILANWLNAENIGVFVEIMLLWSILVEGHIIARTIDRPWIIGILMAMAVFFAQLQVFVVIKPLFGS